MTVSEIEKCFASKLFLAASILTAIYAVIGVDIFAFFMAAGMFLTYTAARKTSLKSRQTGIKLMCGTVRASKIVTAVFTILLSVAAVVCYVLIPVVENDLDGASLDTVLGHPIYSEAITFLEETGIAEIAEHTIADLGKNGKTGDERNEAEKAIDSVPGILRIAVKSTYSHIRWLFETAGHLDLVLIINVVLFVCGTECAVFALALLVLNLFFIGRIYRILKALRDSFGEDGGKPSETETAPAGIWALALGILSAAFAVFLSAGFSDATAAVALALADFSVFVLLYRLGGKNKTTS